MPTKAIARRCSICRGTGQCYCVRKGLSQTTCERCARSGRCHLCNAPVASSPKWGVFQTFLAVLRKAWWTHTPVVRPIKEALTSPQGPDLPKASTFYAGRSSTSGLHVFVHFQHSSQPWQVGQFTINIVLSNREGAPEAWTDIRQPADEKSTAERRTRRESHRAEGDYRIGPLLGRKDKWWHLQRDADPLGTEAWRPTSYDNPEVVIAEAITDVLRDLRFVFDNLGVRSSTVVVEPTTTVDGDRDAD